ncbi:sterol-4-alpha-carboxylate 3-dehydrogenase [Penicillium taxi]|uniref:sterol-4-alpha-carboxylate 3-dehydrogenase n=1 Tax=Penicillium taxi TaxID=168475 RepID=UPI0025458512|nr:sterol-4-alpha-carboxylate 3-dehydrogenase [Penicillium taxi]KAJ5899979.1 sterol-4-alpha-carboxylate 3-dehydrogenase [Penicillium taxi]
MKPKSFDSVLITGGCGFYGSHIIRSLLEYEPTCTIYVLDINITKQEFPTVSYYHCDVSRRARVQEIFEQLQPRPRVVFHLVCPTSIIRNDERCRRVNIDGTRHILELSQRAGVKVFVYTSSSAVVHDNVSDLIEADETMPILKPPHQKNVYTYSTAIAEEEVLAANRTGGMLTVALRPCSTFGPDNPEYMGRLVELCKNNKARFQMGKNNLWDFVYVVNVAHACLLAAERLLLASGNAPLPDGQRVEGEIFNITDGERMNFWDFTLAVSAAMGKPVQQKDIRKITQIVALIFFSEWGVSLFSLGRKQSNMARDGVISAYIQRTLNINKAKNVLGYYPIVSLRDGIQESVDWYMNHNKEKW